LTSPFPRDVNPHVEEADRQTLAWLDESGMLPARDHLEGYRQARYGWLGARTYPYASREMLQLVTDWCVWLFAFDDAFCESDRRAGDIARALPQLFAILDGNEVRLSERNPFARAMLDIKRRIAAHGDADQLERWGATTKDYLVAQVWEAANREAGIVPTLNDYIFMRRRTGAMLTVFALIDLAAGVRLTPEEWRHPDVTAVTMRANDVVVWDNDLISYVKERDAANSCNNLVSVLTRHRHCSIQQAMDRIRDMRDKAIADMVALRPVLEGMESEEVLVYVRGLEYWISGSVDYSLTSSRYPR
jgi:hypothetical protein